MITKRTAIIVTSSLFFVIALVIVADLITELLVNTNENARDGISYAEPHSVIFARLQENVTDGTIALKLNTVNNATDPLTRDAWIENNLKVGYAIALTPPVGSKYLIINVTLKNLEDGNITFRYSDIVIVDNDHNVYYANYGVCDHPCVKSVLLNQTLSSKDETILYILYSVPENIDAAKVIYLTSHPPIVINLP